MGRVKETIPYCQFNLLILLKIVINTYLHNGTVYYDTKILYLATPAICTYTTSTRHTRRYERSTCR